MKIIMFNGSPHADGTTARGLGVIREELEKEGAVTEIVQIGGKPVQGCTGCGICRKSGKCRFDDEVNRSRDALAEADGIVLASPVYYGGIAGTFKCFLDRLFYTRPDLRFKAGAIAVALRRSGGAGVFQQLANYFNLSQVIITPSIYWNVFHGTSAEEALEDEEGMQIMRVTGRNMAWLLRGLEAARRGAALPAEEDRKRTNFIH